MGCAVEESRWECDDVSPFLPFFLITAKDLLSRDEKRVWGLRREANVRVFRYFPVVAVVMFWPYAVPPIMELVEDKW
jgi:hypothetical protein